MSDKCPKCGEGLRIGCTHDFACGSFIDTQDGRFYESHLGSCLRRQRDQLLARVAELETNQCEKEPSYYSVAEEGDSRILIDCCGDKYDANTAGGGDWSRVVCLYRKAAR